MQNDIYCKLLGEVHIKLLQTVHKSLHFLHMACDEFTILHLGSYQGGDDFISLLMSTLMVAVHQVLVHLKRVVVLIGLLEFSCHDGHYDSRSSKVL